MRPGATAPTQRCGRRHSVSSTKTYEQCPKRWFFKYHQRVKVEQDVPYHWRFGTVIHAGLEAAFLARREHRGNAAAAVTSMTHYEPEAMEAIERAWAKEAMPETGGGLDDAKAQVQRVLEVVELPAPTHVLGVEHRFEWETPDGTLGLGFGDLVLSVAKGTVLVRDWKSNSSPQTAEVLTADFQLGTYAYAVRQQHPWIEKVYASQYHTPIAKEVRVEIPLDAQLDAVARMEAVAEMIELDTEYAPKPSAACGECVFKSICPAWTEEGRAENEALALVEGF